MEDKSQTVSFKMCSIRKTAIFFAPLGCDQGVLGFSGYCASAKDDKFLLSFNFDISLPSCK